MIIRGQHKAVEEKERRKRKKKRNLFSLLKERSGQSRQVEKRKSKGKKEERKPVL